MKKLTQNHFLQGSAIVTVATFVVSFLNYLFNLLLVKGIRLSDYGEYISVSSYIILFTVPFGAFGNILIRKMGSIDPHLRQSYAQATEHWLYTKIVTKLPILLIVTILAYWLLTTKGNIQDASVLFIFAITFTTLFQTLYLSVLQAYKAFFLYGFYLIVTAVLRLISGGVVVLTHAQLQILYIALVVAALLNLVWGHFLIHRTKSTEEIDVQFQKIQTYLRRRPIVIPLLTTLGIMGLANVDIILVKKLLSPDSAGLYGAVTLLSKIISYITVPIATVGYIFFTGKEHQQKSEQLLLMIAGITAFIGLSAIAAFTLFSTVTITIFFDARFLALRDILWLGGVYGTLYSLVTVFAYYFMAKNSYLSLFSLLALVFQAIGIYFVHNSLAQILIVNSVVLGVITIVYVGLLLTRACQVEVQEL